MPDDITKKKEALARYREFYYAFPKAKELVDKLLDEGLSTETALIKMRYHFGMQYARWKKKKGYSPSYTDYKVSQVYHNPKLKEKYFTPIK